MSIYAIDRVRSATLAAIGNREVTEDDVLKTAQAVAPVCGYIFGHDAPLGLLVEDIINHNIPDQIINRKG